MAAVKAVRHLLLNYAQLVAIVAAEKIAAGRVPQGTPLPAISVRRVSIVRRSPVKARSTQYCTARVQVTVSASTYGQLQAVLTLVRAALPTIRGDVNGVAVDSIHHALDGPDDETDDSEIYMGSIDYMVNFVE